MYRFLALSVFLATLSGAAGAEEYGRIEATFDGESRVWYTLFLEKGSQRDASATFSENKFTKDLHLQGHPRPSFTTSGVLSIDLSYRGEVKAKARPMIVEVTFMPTGMKPPYWTSDRSGLEASVSFDELSLQGPEGKAVGTISAKLCRTEVLSGDPDVNDCKTLDGSFETRVLIEE